MFILFLSLVSFISWHRYKVSIFIWFWDFGCIINQSFPFVKFVRLLVVAISLYGIVCFGNFSSYYLLLIIVDVWSDFGACCCFHHKSRFSDKFGLPCNKLTSRLKNNRWKHLSGCIAVLIILFYLHNMYVTIELLGKGVVVSHISYWTHKLMYQSWY